jgi:Uma2 family endonuclease
MTNAPAIETMTLDAFVRRFEKDRSFELIDGEIIPIMPTVLGHNHVSDNLVWALNQHIRQEQLGKNYMECACQT